MDFGLRTFLEGVEFKREKILCMVENRKNTMANVPQY